MLSDDNFLYTLWWLSWDIFRPRNKVRDDNMCMKGLYKNFSNFRFFHFDPARQRDSNYT